MTVTAEKSIKGLQKRQLSAPTVVNLELTELCNVKCRHCYNFWRDDSMGVNELDTTKLDALIGKFVEAGVFHVVLSGGEPMANFELLEYGFKKLQENNISISCNSNLMLATKERCERLAAVGLDHILTSLPSCDPATNDYIMGQVGSFERIMEGITNARAAGIRVSVNMVVTRKNLDTVYPTAKLIADKGCQKLFVTRAVPPTYSHTAIDPDVLLTPEEQKFSLDEAIRARDELGIMIGTLVSYPLCFLGDLEKYSDFVGRGCPAQSGNVMAVNATGEVHACVHEEQAYGNVFESSIQEVFQSRAMREWHTAGYHYPGCDGCPYINVCESGCSMVATAVNGVHASKDPLFVGPNAFEKHFKLVRDESVPAQLKAGLKLQVPDRLRFRDEDGFTLVNMRWGNSMPIENWVADFLKERKGTGETFTLEDFGPDHVDYLANLLYKDVVETAELQVNDLRSKAGLSINLDALPSEILRVA